MYEHDYLLVPTENAKPQSNDLWLSIQTASPLSMQSITEQLLVLQTAFPTVLRNYDENEYRALQKLWYDIFKNVPEQLMQEAIKRFIINDRKGFFPSPGQIVGYIEQIVKEQREAEEMRRQQEHYRRLIEYDRLVEAGENCSNCAFCERKADRYGAETMYCTNEKSINYEGTRGCGVAQTLRCDYFKWVQAAVVQIGGIA